MGSSPTTTLFTTMSGRTCGLSSALQNILFRDGSHPWSWSHFGEVPSPCRRAAAAPGRERHEDDAGRDAVFIDTTLTTPVVTLQAAGRLDNNLVIMTRPTTALSPSRPDCKSVTSLWLASGRHARNGIGTPRLPVTL
jgi:hypothetical protein